VQLRNLIHTSSSLPAPLEPHNPSHTGTDSGSVWILAPFLALAIMATSSIAVDSAIRFLATIELQQAAVAAAEAAVGAISNSSFYLEGTYVIDPKKASEVALFVVERQSLSAVTLVGPPLVWTSGQGVCVRLNGRPHVIFAKALGWIPAYQTISVTAAALATGAPEATPPICHSTSPAA
jgi:hypothetical protein